MDEQVRLRTVLLTWSDKWDLHNSLGLISDAFHMFFDCTALIGGLAASIVTRWAANERFSYGYVRAEILAGFANGIFLVFIAFYIFTEAFERLFEPPEVKHERLFVISVLGLLVNLVGIFVFQHGGAHHGHSHADAGHGHSHAGGGHGHSHGDHMHAHASSQHSLGNPLLNNLPPSPSFVSEKHSHMNGKQAAHGHSHAGGSEGGSQSQIMQGVFLHILADTLGSVGVIISAVLMSQFGWMIADPICSLFIASLVAISVYPLLRDSISVIMQRTPKQLEQQLSACYHRINSLEGVHSIHEPHFWTLCSDNHVGTIGVEISRSADYVYVQNAVRTILTQAGVKQVCIEIHYANM